MAAERLKNVLISKYAGCEVRMQEMECTFVRADRDRQEKGDIVLLVEVILRGIKGTGNLCPVVTFPSGEVVGRGSKSLQISLGNRSFSISHCDV